MARNEYLRRLLTPGADRWQPMLIALALFAAGAGGAVLANENWIVSMALSILAVAAWVVGACALVGYVRWYFAGEMERALRDRDRPDERK
jgi:hypothetical protein